MTVDHWLRLWRWLLPRHNSLSAQITQRMVLLSIIGVLGLITAMGLALMARLERSHHRLAQANHAAAFSVDLLMAQIHQDLHATQAALAIAPQPDAIVQELFKRHPSLVDVQWVGPAGTIRHQSSQDGSPWRPPRQEFWPTPSPPEQTLFVGDVGFERGFPYVDLAVRDRASGAVLWGRVALDEVWRKTLAIDETAGYRYIANGQGQIMVVQDPRWQGSEQGLHPMEQQPEHLAATMFQVDRGLGGGWVLVSVHGLRTVDWYAIAEQPVRELMGPVVGAGLVWLVAITLTIGLVYNGLSLTRRQIVGRLEQLQRVVRTFTVNDHSFDGALAAIAGEDELGTLARSFQTLTDQLRDSFAALADNNQKMKILNDALSQSEQKLTQFLEAIPVGVFVMDATGKPYYANQRAQQILGKGIVNEASVKNLVDVYHAYIAGTNQPYPTQEQPIYRALQGQASTVDNLEIHKGEQRIPLEIWGTPIFDAEEQILYAIAVFQDISDRKQAELERQRFTTQLEQLNIAYECFVPKEFLQLLAKRSIVEVQVGDAVEREMSVLFADICHFASLAEQIPPDEAFKLINAFLSRMEPPITRHKGFVDKYIGDEIMALFEQGCADDAVRAAIAMLRQLAHYNLTRQRRDRPPIAIGIGINTGSVVLGTVGGRNRMDSTVIGDTVNLASRLERLTRTYGVSLLISHHTFFQLDHNHPYHIRLIDRVQVKGKSEAVSVFEVFDADPTPLRVGKLQTRTRFEQGLMLYYSGNWSSAAQRFQTCIHENPGDSVAPIYLQRCHAQLADSLI